MNAVKYNDIIKRLSVKNIQQIPGQGSACRHHWFYEGTDETFWLLCLTGTKFSILLTLLALYPMLLKVLVMIFMAHGVALQAHYLDVRSERITICILALLRAFIAAIVRLEMCLCCNKRKLPS